MIVARHPSPATAPPVPRGWQSHTTIRMIIPWDDIGQYALVFGLLVVSAFGAPIPEEIAIVTGGVMVGREWNNPNSWMTWWAHAAGLHRGRRCL